MSKKIRRNKVKKPSDTINVRVYRTDWDILANIAQQEKHTLQDMFSIVVNIAGKLRA